MTSWKTASDNSLEKTLSISSIVDTLEESELGSIGSGSRV